MPSELLPPVVREQFLFGTTSPKKESFPEKRFWRPSIKSENQNTQDGNTDLSDRLPKMKKKKKKVGHNYILWDNLDLEHMCHKLIFINYLFYS